ncbi:MAG: protein translocase SEC61 complex subunit gamma [Thermoplasmata archaeon]
MDILERSWDVQKKIEERAGRIGKGKYGRVLKMARKPDMEEYKKTLAICFLGIILIGGLGFLIYWLFDNIPEYLNLMI